MRRRGWAEAEERRSGRGRRGEKAGGMPVGRAGIMEDESGLLLGAVGFAERTDEAEETRRLAANGKGKVANSELVEKDAESSYGGRRMPRYAMQWKKN